MWWLTHARAPLATQKVLLSSAPQARRGRVGSGRPTLRGTYPRERRMSSGVRRTAGASERATESSVRMWIGRSWTRKPSAIDVEALVGVVVAVGDRLVGDVAGREHEGLADVGEQHVVERGVGEHHAEVGRAGSHRPRHRRVRTPAGDHDRPLRTAQERCLILGQLDQPDSRFRCRCHEGEGPVLAVLASAEGRHRLLVDRPAGEVVAADALDGEDRARRQALRRRSDRVAGVRDRERRSGGVRQRGPRPADRAGVRLGVEAAVERIVVLRLARGAHLEAGHRRGRPVVGDAAHDREPRAAVRAVDERIAVAAVGGVE